MTDLADRSPSTGDPVDEVNAWLEENWDPDLTVAEWWDRLGNSGWAHPSLPENAYGKGLSRGDAVRVQQAIAEFGALGAPGGLGLLLAAPTITTHGTPEQIERYVKPIVTGQQAWCQLFSEPGAGSDLAGLNARAVQDGEEWIVNGQKVWTSGGQIADMGMLIARTNPEVPKHQGITYFAIDMHQPGIEIRPLRELTGRAMFNEVFMTDARAEDAAVIGGLHNGWAVANTTLMFERAGLGAGGSGGGSMASPGTVAGDLDKRAGDFVGSNRRRSADPTPESSGSRRGNPYVELARSKGKDTDPLVRQQLAKLHTLTEIAKYHSLRSKAARAAGQPDIPGLPNIAKLSMSDILRLQRDLGLGLLGPMGTLHAYTAEQGKKLAEATGDPYTGIFTEGALFAQGPPIYGGTDQIQRNIIGERVLGLPKEPNQDKVLPFKDLPKNG
ncbi:acyl-CoA dehydrogenase family protein [Actinomarinicola tropica]|uniref:Acyl-CoA dehydrogenase n=1 Tax=Actinomarinicola tropica TaxID=2789776 RepID=A0A5Q2RKB0_9ACTN|nr:acyl-CoA dehydrogenase family protein [Actinomarinicola tropica]QGG94497.1 acyl-CoA dehydrogenase [Actinomarinicola tropica]